jgi:VanZ family protein
MGLIFLSSLLRTDGSTPGFAFIGRIPSELQSGMHVPMFFGLTLILLVFLKRFEKWKPNQILFVFVLANCVGMLNEGLQMLIPYRHASLGDVGLNLVGSLLGIVVYFRLYKRKPWIN